MTPHFETYPPPKRPLPPEEVWYAGELLTPPRDYLLYSRLHLPSLHLSALGSVKITPGLKASIAFMHSPAALFLRPGAEGGGSMSSSGSNSGQQPSNQPNQPSSSHQSSPPPLPTSPPGNLFVSLQQDTGRWATEYTYSAKDGMFGLRGLWNFGMTEDMLKPLWQQDFKSTVLTAGETREIFATPPTLPLSETSERLMGQEDDQNTRIDQEDSWENGLRGRFSAGGEVYFSVKQRSLGCEYMLLVDQCGNSG